MAAYQKKLEIVEAVQFRVLNLSNHADVEELEHPKLGWICYLQSRGQRHKINDDDWIVTDVQGNKSPLDPVRFAQLYVIIQ